MKKAFLSFAILAMILFSCTKPGPIGPTGPAGTNGKDGVAGTNGAAGANGTNGTNGINGNANVIGSNTVVSSNWTSLSDDGINFDYSITVTWASITQAIVDKGVVMVYLQNGSSWIALPLTISGTTSGKTYSGAFVFSINAGAVNIEFAGFNGNGSPGTTTLNGKTFRIVAISASAKTAYPYINWGNYEEVRELIK